MRIAVTGGLGFVGQEIISQIQNINGATAVCVDFLQERVTLYEGYRHPIMRSIYRTLMGTRVIDPVEFLDSQVFASLNIDAVIHAGADVNTRDMGSKHLFDNNVSYTEKLVRQCARATVPMVFISSAAIYGSDGLCPNNPYGMSKALAETIINAANVRTTILRLFNVFGEFEDHKGRMASVPFQIDHTYGTLKMFCLDSKRDFVPVTTVAEVAIAEVQALLNRGRVKDHLTFDVGTGTATSFRDIYTMITGRAEVDSESEFPEELRGRYQHFTQAGQYGVPVLGTHRSTKEGIKHFYG